MSLLTNLISYWKLDEASGSALDANGSNTLTDNGTVGSGTGKIGNCRTFAAASSQYLSHADNTDLSIGNVSFTVACWVKLASKPASKCCLVSKGMLTSGEFYLAWNNSSDRFEFSPYSSSGYGGGDTVTANTFGAPSTGTWYFVVAWYDSGSTQIGICVNAGTADTASHTGGAFDGTGAWALGSGYPHPGQYLDGSLDEVGFWKRVLTSQERTDLYNGGSGLAYSSFGGGGSTASGAGTADGAATATGAGASLAASAGTATGAATATGVGASLSASAGSATGAATAAGVGASLSAASGTAAGAATAAGVGASLAASSGSATGAATATGVGSSSAAGSAAGSATGAATVTGVGAALSASAGSATGAATATGVGASRAASAGSATGVATATGVGTSLSGGASVGTATGVATATGVGASRAAATGTAAGASTATGVGASTAAGVTPAASTAVLRDADVLEQIAATLLATNEFDCVVRALPDEVGLPTGATAAAVVQPLSWDQADTQHAMGFASQAPFDDSGALTRHVLWQLTLIARDADAGTRDRLADRLYTAAANALDGQSIGGLTVPAWTKLLRGKYSPPKAPERRLVCTGEFSYIVPGYSGHGTDA